MRIRNILQGKPLLCTLIWLISLCAVRSAAAQDTIVIRSGQYTILHEIFLRDSLWTFHTGDLSNGQFPFADTIHRERLHNIEFGKSNPPAGWTGIGWFQLWVKVDSNLVNKKLYLRINHDGASEIFVDGKPVGGFGKLGRSANEMEAIRAPGELIPFWFHDAGAHLVAVHYSNYFGIYPDFLGFQFWIGDFKARSEQIAYSRRMFNFVPLCAAAEIILSLLHFFLFLFYRKQKLNLYFAVFVLIVGLNNFAVYNYYLASSPFLQYNADFLTMEFKVLMMASAVMILYVLDYKKIPRWRLLTLSAISLAYLTLYFLKFFVLHHPVITDYFSLVFSLCIFDGLWSAYRLAKKGQPDVWLILIGTVSIILVYFFAWADSFDLWSYIQNPMRIFVMSMGQLILPFCLSLYLALDFARTNQQLTAKLSEVESLSAETLAQETEKRESLAAEARRLEELVHLRTTELRNQADELRELDSVKSRFFTNITHEFKTPLTLIINPAKELIADPTGKNTSSYLRLILDNASRVLGLINQLLELSKLESGSMEFIPEPLDLAALIRLHIRSYESLVHQKGISINFSTGLQTCWILSDRDKLDKIILNILSNAIKFTDTGEIEVFLKKPEENIFNLSVRDTGHGIPATKLPYIFKRFYQADPSDTRSAEGTGIGLAVAKELVEFMGGQISAESIEGAYTEIQIRMPFQTAEAVEQPIWEMAGFIEPVPLTETASASADDDKPLILVIEDHEELRDFMYHSLSDKYRLLTAADGETGIALGLQHIPNVIITDLMMPGIDGYQVSSRFKKDVKTSHIPVIILTAKADIDSRIQGIETGADGYLGKPFDKRELFALIENLITVRKQLLEYYNRRDLWLNDASAMPSLERDFITRVRTAVEAHLDEDGYSADQLARDMGLSRTQLHRKLKALIGQAPGELIRIVRLQYAHDLLQRRVANVSEVAYMVGFSSPASFSTSFSRHFGFPPRDVVPVN